MKTAREERYLMDKKDESLIECSIGEDRRDASPGIRGFVYQNLIAIEELVDQNVKRVFCEYIEDITVEDNTGNCKIIQAKYYSSELPNAMQKEVFREMYFQYLKLLETAGFNKILPILNVFSCSTDKSIEKPDYEEAKEWVKVDEATLKITSLNELEKPGYNKVSRENVIINSFGSEEHLEKYYNEYKIFNQNVDLNELRERIGEKLVNALSSQARLEDTVIGKLQDKDQAKILLALSYMKILETFDRMSCKNIVDEQRKEALKHKELLRNDFMVNLYELIRKRTEENQEIDIQMYVEVIVTDTYFLILNGNPELSQIKEEILTKIYENTKEWLGELTKSKEGQYKLINTVTFEHFNKIERFKYISIDARSKIFQESMHGIRTFLKYFWKIMLNICMKYDGFDINNNADMLDPKSYVLNQENDYICTSFRNVDFVKTSVILPSVNADEGRQKRKNIYSRMYEQKPQRWFLGGDISKRGIFDYQYSPADIRDLVRVSDIRESNEIFYLECMECIGIDDDEWNIIEDCNDCIFSKKCKGGYKC